jgi:RNA polymerase sigma factor (sigma-70 family)
MQVFDQMEEKFELWYPAVYRYFRLRGANAETANNLSSEVFKRALQKWGTYRPKKGPYSIWLFSIARNNDLKEWKNQGQSLVDVNDASEQQDKASLSPETADKMEECHKLLQAISTLIGRDREILALKISARFTNQQIAEITGLSENKISLILYQTLDCLHAKMAKAPLELSCE